MLIFSPIPTLPLNACEPFAITVRTISSPFFKTLISTSAPAIFTLDILALSHCFGMFMQSSKLLRPVGRSPNKPSEKMRQYSALSAERCAAFPSGYASTAYGTCSPNKRVCVYVRSLSITHVSPQANAPRKAYSVERSQYVLSPACVTTPFSLQSLLANRAFTVSSALLYIPTVSGRHIHERNISLPS